MEREFKVIDKKGVKYGDVLSPAEYADLQGVDPSRVTVLQEKLDCHMVLGRLKIVHSLRNDTFFDTVSPLRGRSK